MKSVILYLQVDEEDGDCEEDKSKDAFVTDAVEDPAVSETFMVEGPGGAVMADTGCKVAVGGRRWHKQLQKKMDQLGRKRHSEEHEEYFQFGHGIHWS